MVLVLLGTQNNSFHRLLEEVDYNIENGNIQDEVIVQAGFTDYKSKNMKIFDLVSQEKMESLIDKADLIITHGGVGSIVPAIKKGKKIIAVPRLKKYEEHVNNHQIQIVNELKGQGFIVGIDKVEDLNKALKEVETMEKKEYVQGTSNVVKIIDDFIQSDTEKREQKKNKIFERVVKWKKKEL